MSIICDELASTVCTELTRFIDGGLPGRWARLPGTALYAFGYENARHLDTGKLIEEYHGGQWDVRINMISCAIGAPGQSLKYDTGPEQWDLSDGLIIIAHLEDYVDTDEDRELDRQLEAEQRAEMRMECVQGAYFSGGTSHAIQAMNDFDGAYGDYDPDMDYY